MSDGSVLLTTPEPTGWVLIERFSVMNFSKLSRTLSLLNYLVVSRLLAECQSFCWVRAVRRPHSSSGLIRPVSLREVRSCSGHLRPVVHSDRTLKKYLLITYTVVLIRTAAAQQCAQVECEAFAWRADRYSWVLHESSIDRNHWGKLLLNWEIPRCQELLSVDICAASGLKGTSVCPHSNNRLFVAQVKAHSITYAVRAKKYEHFGRSTRLGVSRADRNANH